MNTKTTSPRERGRGQAVYFRTGPLAALAALALLCATSSSAWGTSGPESLTESARPKGESERGNDIENYSGEYSYKIDVLLPAFRGIEPKVSIKRYSQALENGKLGMFAKLDGFPAIERFAPRRGTPTFSGTDVFFLKSDELMPCTTLGGTHIPPTMGQPFFLA